MARAGDAGRDQVPNKIIDDEAIDEAATFGRGLC
jgi:hypothetical protein